MCQRSSKCLAKAHAAFRQAVTEFLKSKGAVEDDWYDLRLPTRAGPLHISVWDYAIMTRFSDVEKGKQFTASIGSSCNPFTGKWNFHYENSVAALKPAVVLAYFGGLIEQLLAWEDSP